MLIGQKLEKGFAGKVSDSLSGRVLQKAIAKPSSAGFDALLTLEELSRADAISDSLTEFVGSIVDIADNLELVDPITPADQDICSDPWRKLLDKCHDLGMFGDGFTAKCPGLEEEEFRSDAAKTFTSHFIRKATNELSTMLAANPCFCPTF